MASAREHEGDRPRAITVLAVGNPIMGDDGIGPAILEQLLLSRPDLADTPGLEVVDGGTEGMSLLPLVEDSTHLLLLDAVIGGPAKDAGPGSVVQVDGDQVPRLLAVKLSPHQVGLLDVLSGARLRGREPEAISVVGIVPVDVDLRVGLTPVVESAVAAAAEAAAAVVDGWRR